VQYVTGHKYSAAKSNPFAQAIIEYLEHFGHMAWRQSTEGRYRPGKTFRDTVGFLRQTKGTFIPAMKTGLGDVTAVIGGKYVSIEIKIGSDRQRPNQKQFEADLKKAGGGYILVKTWEEFILKIRQFL
jgi:hypothetical protein